MGCTCRTNLTVPQNPRGRHDAHSCKTNLWDGSLHDSLVQLGVDPITLPVRTGYPNRNCGLETGTAPGRRCLVFKLNPSRALTGQVPISFFLKELESAVLILECSNEPLRLNRTGTVRNQSALVQFRFLIQKNREPPILKPRSGLVRVAMGPDNQIWVQSELLRLNSDSQSCI